ncbi:hypothetical protein D3C85_1630200 [compost metagenome]
MYYLGPPLTLSFGLFGDGADHRLVKVNVLYLDVRYFDPPRIGLGVKYLLDISIQPFSSGE